MPRPRSALAVLVAAVPPHACLVAATGGAVEPLVHAPQAIQSAREGGVSVMGDAVREHECTHARPFAQVCGHVGSSHHGVLGGRRFIAGFLAPVSYTHLTLPTIYSV